MKKPAYSSIYIVKKVTVDRTISSLAKNNIQVNAKEAETILNFLYHIANTYNKQDTRLRLSNLKKKSNH